MRKQIVLLSLSSIVLSSVLANDSMAYKNEKKVQEKKVVLSSSKNIYDIALKNFRKKNYTKAYEQFNSLFLNNMGDMLINFYLGRSAYELGKYEFALSAYDRILINEPKNTRVRLEIAQTYFKMKLYTQAIKEFSIVLEDKKIPSAVKKTISAKIAFMRNSQQKHFVNVTTIAGVMYDSNVNTTPSTGAFDIYNPNSNSVVTVSSSNQEESSTVYQVIGQANHTYKYSDNFILNSSATALFMKYINHKEKDIQAISLSTSPTYLAKNYKISYTLSFDKVNLGHESYQNNFYFNPKYTRVINSAMLYTTGIKLGRINFVEDDTKNANVFEFQNSLKYLNDNYGLFTFGLNLGKELEIDAVRTDVDHKYYNIYANNSYDFLNDYTLQTSLNYKEYNYSDMDVNFQSKRKDKKSDVSISVQKPLEKNLLINVGSTYTNRDSNHASSNYDKYMLKANLLWNVKVK